MYEAPELAPSTSTRLRRSTPAALPTTSACASVAQFVAPTVLEITLTVWPWPSSPTCRIFSPIASKNGRAAATSSSLPPAMIVSVPSSAFGAAAGLGYPRLGLRRGAVVDRHLVTRAGEVRRHPRAHDPQSYEPDGLT